MQFQLQDAICILNARIYILTFPVLKPKVVEYNKTRNEKFNSRCLFGSYLSDMFHKKNRKPDDYLLISF
jgi:hypothetical protein